MAGCVKVLVQLPCQMSHLSSSGAIFSSCCGKHQRQIFLDCLTGLKVNDQLVAYATRFLAVRLKKYVRSHHHALKAKVQCDFSSAYSPDHTNIL